MMKNKSKTANTKKVWWYVRINEDEAFVKTDSPFKAISSISRFVRKDIERGRIHFRKATKAEIALHEYIALHDVENRRRQRKEK